MNKTQIQEMLDLYIEAEKKVLQGQSVEMEGRKLTRADLGQIREGQQYWERRLNSASGKRKHALATFD